MVAVQQEPKVIGKLTVTSDTIAKRKTTAQFSDFERLQITDDRWMRVQEGQIFKVLAHRQIDNRHVKATFDEQYGVGSGFNTWNFFEGHILLQLDMPEYAQILQPGLVHTSERGLQIIKNWEGFRAEPYICAGGVLTIGYGSTHGVEWGQSITEAEASERLRREVQIYEKAVRDAVWDVLELTTQEEYDAMVSLTYNIGGRAFKASSVARFHNAQRWVDAANAFLMWRKSNGRVLQGLINRRNEERSLYSEGKNIDLN
ncbi:MAG: lysozyme [Cyanobacteria bacterium J06638_22]